MNKDIDNFGHALIQFIGHSQEFGKVILQERDEVETACTNNSYVNDVFITYSALCVAISNLHEGFMEHLKKGMQ